MREGYIVIHQLSGRLTTFAHTYRDDCSAYTITLTATL